MRHCTEQGLALIRHFEGFSAQPYKCPAGYDTIGYGHVIRMGEAFSEAISEQQAALLLEEDIRTAERSVLRLVEVPLEDRQFDALVSFTYNLGGAALQRSTLRRKVNGGYHKEAPAEFAKWIWAGGRILPGLVRRRKAEADLYAEHTQLFAFYGKALKKAKPS